MTACASNKISNSKSGSVDKIVIQESNRYIVKDNLTVFDKNTKLLWEVKSKSNSHNVFYWFKAENYCDNLIHAGSSDWYLPTIEELKTLLTAEKSLNSGYINSEYFSQNEPFSYWSSTEGYGHGGWYVDFEFGGDSAYEDSKKKYARCVIKSVRDN